MKLGITMINMYVDMVNDEFGPLLREIDARNEKLRQAATIEARKKLGIYDLYVRRLKLSTELEETEKELSEYEDRQYDKKTNKYTCKLDMVTNDMVKKYANGIDKKIRDAHENAVKSIKLSGLTGEISDLFKELPNIIGKLSKQLEASPMPKLLKK